MTEKIERGNIYELDDGWGLIRVTDLYSDYTSFNPDEERGQFVTGFNIKKDSNQRFSMKRSKFEDLIIENHGKLPP